MDPPLCPGHNKPCRRIQVRKQGANIGRFFFACGEPRELQCKFFEWADAPSKSSSSAAAQRGFVINKKPMVKLEIASHTHFKVHGGRADAGVQQAVTSVGGMSLSDSEHLVMLNRYEDLLGELKKNSIQVKGIPPKVLAAMQKAKKVESDMSFQDAMLLVEKKLPPEMWSSMYPFQRQAVAFGVQRGGKVLVGDEMGLGKTISALGIAAFYKDLPLLIISPSSVKRNWLRECVKWCDNSLLSCQGEEQIQIIGTGKDKIRSVPVAIISYDLAEKMSDSLKKRHYRSVICDESHYMKNPKAKRTKALLPLLKAAKRTILLSGTPALSRPSELFPQLKALECSIFTAFKDFGLRYCAGVQRPFGWDFSGSSNLDELNIILTSLCMIRRTKVETLKDLPGKNRRVVSVSGIAQNNEQREVLGALQSEIGRTGGISKDGKLKLSKNGREKMLQLYVDTATLKVDAVTRYVEKLVDKGEKFIVFAHHQVVMEALDNWAETRGVGFIRIDGATVSKNRATLVTRFQNKSSCKLALLSMTAAGQGITLTAARKVVFCELHWNPGTLLQCEDRVHRIGQQHDVEIVYLIGKNSFDEVLWKMISKKLNVIKGAIGGHDDATNDFGKSTDTLKYTPLDAYFAKARVKKESQQVLVDDDDDDDDGDDDILAPVLLSSSVVAAAASSPAAKRKQAAFDEVEDSDDDILMLTPARSASSPPPPVKKSRLATPKKRECSYGEKCYRKNPQHFIDFAHPWKK